MNNLQNEIIKTKKIYREIFLKSKEALDAQLCASKKMYVCNHCRKDCEIKFNSATLFDVYPKDCVFRKWQAHALELLENSISKDIYLRIKAIDERAKCFECSKCSSCCKLAGSEFSYEELKKRAENGDKFSKEFVSIFVPYESIEDARAVYPEYVSLVEEKFPKDSPVYFYHCPKQTEDGLCGDYENRPSICRDFPSNPLVVLPPKCSFNQWKNEVEITALMLHSLIELVGFYKEKLANLLK